MSEKILLGSVVGPRGPKGEQGDDYVLTEQDKSEIAQQIGEMDWLPAAVITVNCIHDYSELPIWATVKLLNADGVLMEQSEYAAEQKKFKVTPFTDYILRFEADGYQAVADYPVSSIPKSGEVVTKRFVPSEAVTFTVDYKVDGQTVQHNVVEPHGSVSYTGDPVSVSGKVWTGFDDASGNGNLADVVDDVVVNATFCVPEEPSEIKDMSLYDYIYSEVEGDNAAYTREEFAWILLNDAAKTYWSAGNLISIKTPSTWPTGDISLVFRLEAFNHFRRIDNNEFALTTWLMVGVLTAGRRLNATGTNIGGWAASEAHTYIDSTYYAALPIFWRSLIRKVKVLSSAGNMSAAVVEAENYLWLPSHTEVHNSTTTTPYKDEVDPDAETKNFPYYVSNATRIKKTFNGTGSMQSWWLRSPDPSSVSSFHYINSNYVADDYLAMPTAAWCWALGFCI